MTSATDTQALPHYRVVHYVVNPYSGLRVPVAAVVRRPDGSTEPLVAPTLPGPDCLGSVAAYRHIIAYRPCLARLEKFDVLPEYLGPHFTLSAPHQVPTAAWRRWIADVVFRREPASEDASRKYSPQLKTLGRKFFKNYKLDQFVKDNFRLAPQYGLDPITHWTEIGSIKVLMEPLSPLRTRPEKDMVEASTRLAAYRLRIDQHADTGKHELLAYTLPGLDPTITWKLRESLEGVGNVYDLADSRQEQELIELVQQAGDQRLIKT